MQNDASFVCNLNAIPPEQRPIHQAVSEKLFSSTIECQPLTNGYAFRWSISRETLQDITQFIANERLCCPFFGFTVTLPPSADSVWLHITGAEGVVAFIEAELGVSVVLANQATQDEEH